MLIEQIDRLFDKRCLTVFEVKTEISQSLGVAIADPALQSGMSLLFTLYMLTLPLGIILWHCLFGVTHCYFMAHMTLQCSIIRFVISYLMRLSIGRVPFPLER
jgi:hypothetical protein